MSVSSSSKKRLSMGSNLLFVFSLLLLQNVDCKSSSSSSASAVIVKNTGLQCSQSLTQLACSADSDSVIVVVSIFYRYSPSQCANLHSFDENGNNNNNNKSNHGSITECLGVQRADASIEHQCNGKANCTIAMAKSRSHVKGHYGTTCDFWSNLAEIVYHCVPSTSNNNNNNNNFKSFDICEKNGPEYVSGVQRGFIHSPGYPHYYGNSRKCAFNLRHASTKQQERLFVYQMSKQLEDPDWFGKNGPPVDFYTVNKNTDEKHTGQLSRPRLVYSELVGDKQQNENFNIYFQSDWITTERLKSPKGFLLYFEYIPIEEPTTTTTTTTTTAPTTTSPTTTETTNVISTISPSTQAFVNPNSQRLAASPLPVHLAHHNRRRAPGEEEAFLVISCLVGIIGILVLVIFGLLFLFRRPVNNAMDDSVNKPHQHSDHSVYDDKSFASQSMKYDSAYYDPTNMTNNTNYNDGQTTSNNSSSSSSSSRSKTPASVSLNERVRLFLSRSIQNLASSSAILIRRSSSNNGNNESQTTINNNDNNHHSHNYKDEMYDNLSKEKLQLNKNAVPTSKNYNNNSKNVNEFCDEMSYEKEIAIDRLKLFNGYSAKSNASNRTNSFKKSNIELALEQQQRGTAAENSYVSNPITNSTVKEEDEDNSSSPTPATTTTTGSPAECVDPSKLHIYEVDFANNQAYIVPKKKTSAKTSSGEGMKLKEEEIYQTIDDDTKSHKSTTPSELSTQTTSTTTSTTSTTSTTNSNNTGNNDDSDNTRLLKEKPKLPVSVTADVVNVNAPKADFDESTLSLNDSSRAILPNAIKNSNNSNKNEIYDTPSNKRFFSRKE